MTQKVDTESRGRRAMTDFIETGATQRLGGRLLLGLVGLLLALNNPGPARAQGNRNGDNGQPHCGDGHRAKAARICADYADAPRADVNDPWVQQALIVWRNVEGPVDALTGRGTGLAVLGPGAKRPNGKAFPLAAYICPGSPPTVYLPWSLLNKVYGPRSEYPEDFLAFVLGHELGHRLNDFTWDGCQLGAFERPGRGMREEQLADFRGAFFTTIGGYSSRTLASDATVSRFLAAEFGLRKRTLDSRGEALTEALLHFDAYEGLYQAALAVTFTGDHQTAARLVGWADELVESHGVPLPELKVMHAIALMRDAAEDAPWFVTLESLPDPPRGLSCQAAYPSHSALGQPPAGARKRGDPAKIAAATKKLKRARRLLEDAGDLGANPFVVATARSCVSLYLGKAEAAQQAHLRALRLAGEHAPKAVKALLAANGGVIAFAAYVAGAPVPDASDSKALKAWAKGLKKVRTSVTESPEITLWWPALSKLPKAVKQRRPTEEEGLQCRGAGARADSAAMTQVFAGPAAVFGPVGRCPTGWSVAFTIPSTTAAAQKVGVTTCVPRGAAAGPKGRQLVHLKLPALTAPPAAAVDLTIVFMGSPPAALATPAAWACVCETVVAQGTSDVGGGAFHGSCDALGLPSVVLLTGADGAVRQVVAFPLP